MIGLLLLSLCLFAAPGARAAGPSLSGCELYQLGASELVLGLTGQDLPEPELMFTETQALITLRKSRDAPSAGIRRSAAVPLVLDVTKEQVSEDVVIRIRTARPLQLRSQRGAAPSNAYMLRMITVEETNRLRKRDAAPGGGPSPQPVPLGGGERITLDLREVELRDVFRMLADHMKKNIIIDPSLPSIPVTLVLRNASMDDVFHYLMRAYNISFYTFGEDTLVIGTRDGLSRLSGAEETRAFNIAYADPGAVRDILVGLTGLPAERFVVDARLRSLYVTSNPLKLGDIEKLVRRLDTPGRQVMLYAKIFEFAEGDTKDVETALNAVYDHWWFSYSGARGGRGGYIDDNRLGRSFTGPPSGYPLPGMTGLETPMNGVWREFDAAFRALETRGRGRTLANPSVIALDGQEAQIRLTEEYPYISDRDEAGNPTWTTETVGPQLRLTPRVGRDGVISLQIEITTGEVIEMITGSTGEQMPRTSTRSVKTQLRVRDGEPFVVGGLFHESRTVQRTRIPVVGQIPLLGELFTYRAVARDRTQVVILVVPYILDTPDGE